MKVPLFDHPLPTLKSPRQRLLLTIALILAFGAAASYWTARAQDKIMRKDLLVQAHLVAKGIDLQRLRRLTGTEDDFFSPDYQRMKEQLTLVRSATPHCRFIYLLGQREDQSVFFFLDSEPLDSEDYSPPGQLFQEASEACRRLFATGDEVVEGPIADRWGIWVSALTPLTDPRSGKVLAVLGLDIASHDWEKLIALHCVVPITITCVLAFIFTLFFILYGRSEREKALLAASKAAIEASERKYHSVVDNIQDVFYRVDGKGKIIMMSPSGGRLLGYASVEELLGHHADILWAKPELRASMVSALERSGAIRDWEFEARRKDDTPLMMAATIHQVKDEQGNPAGYEGIIRDITEQRGAAKALQESELKYRGLFESTPDAIMMVDSNGFFDCNNATLKMFHCSSPQEFILKHPGQLSPPTQPNGESSLAGANRHMEIARQEGSDFFEWIHQRADGSTFPSEVLLSRVEFGSQEILQALVRDITERKRLEAELIQTSITDPLTGVYNRRHFQSILEMETGRVKRYAGVLSLIMFDVDDFKLVNDRFGHEAGDQVLKSLAALVQHRIRRAYVLCRWGGEEFQILCPNTTIEEAVVLAEALLEIMRGSPFPPVGPVSASFGVTDYHVNDQIDDFLRRVDDLVYVAKNAGRNCVRSSRKA
jgi:diguanylate cyclase (GGDEF)-like protein/PAS domain S-box-containing protein